MVDKILLSHEVNKFLEIDFNTYSSIIEEELLESLEELKASIPEKRRSSYGIVSVIALLCKSIYKASNGECIESAHIIYKQSTDFRTVSIGLGLLSHVGVEEPDLILPILKDASDHALWEVKEFAQMFIRKITKVHKEKVQHFLFELTQSSNENHRRFASEALRPVVENKWIQEEPEFSLKVLRQLFSEEHEFPRVSVGNNLSDLSRKNPKLILEVVKELKSLENENSDFIAHRACRNLVKTYPLEVMEILRLDRYEYKKNIYLRRDFE